MSVRTRKPDPKNFEFDHQGTGGIKLRTSDVIDFAQPTADAPATMSTQNTSWMHTTNEQPARTAAQMSNRQAQSLLSYMPGDMEHCAIMEARNGGGGGHRGGGGGGHSGGGGNGRGGRNSSGGGNKSHKRRENGENGMFSKHHARLVSKTETAEQYASEKLKMACANCVFNVFAPTVDCDITVFPEQLDDQKQWNCSEEAWGKYSHGANSSKNKIPEWGAWAKSLFVPNGHTRPETAMVMLGMGTKTSETKMDDIMKAVDLLRNDYGKFKEEFQNYQLSGKPIGANLSEASREYIIKLTRNYQEGLRKGSFQSMPSSMHYNSGGHGTSGGDMNMSDIATPPESPSKSNSEPLKSKFPSGLNFTSMRIPDFPAKVSGYCNCPGGPLLQKSAGPAKVSGYCNCPGGPLLQQSASRGRALMGARGDQRYASTRGMMDARPSYMNERYEGGRRYDWE